MAQMGQLRPIRHQRHLRYCLRAEYHLGDSYSRRAGWQALLNALQKFHCVPDGFSLDRLRIPAAA